MKSLWQKFMAWLESLFPPSPEPSPKPDPVPGPEPQPTPSKPIAIVLAHGAPCHVPAGDKSKEIIYHIGPYKDVRMLEVGDDTFIGDFARIYFRIVDGYAVADDFEHSGVVYCFDHFSINTSGNKSFDNPLKVGDTGGVFRVWRKCYKAVTS